MSEKLWVQCQGGAFNLAAPCADDVRIEDIARALSRLPRYTGHTFTPYFVAHHSVFVSSIVPPELRFEGLMHDATEAYIGDISSPLKRLIGPRIKEIERSVWLAIAKRFGLPEKESREVKYADLVALATEKRDLLPPVPAGWHWDPLPPPREDATIRPWSSEVAEEVFLSRFRDLYRGQ